MTYTAFDPAKPDASTQTLTQMGQSMRDNALTLRDMLASIGMVPGFNASIGAGTPAEVTQWLFKSGTTWVKVVQTWAAGVVTKAAYHISYNSGGAYTPIVDGGGNHVLNLAYDGDGYLISTTWNATP